MPSGPTRQKAALAKDRKGSCLKPRKAARNRACAGIQLHSSGNPPMETRLSDLSPLGCNIAVDEQSVRIGQFVAIRFAHPKPLQAIVRWVRGGNAGIEFLQPLSSEVVERLTAAD